MFYNNIKDVDEVLCCVCEFDELIVVVMKYMNLCGIGCGDSLEVVWDWVYEVDFVLIFGGVIVLNCKVDLVIVEKMWKIFLEIIVVLGFDDDVFVVLVKKKNICFL